MSTYTVGKEFEQTIAGMIRHKLGVNAQRDTRSGSSWHRRSDIVTELPYHFECKNHKTLKPKEWYAQAANSASQGQTPVLVFNSDMGEMALLKFDDLLNIIAELQQTQLQLADVRKPIIVAKTVEDTVSQLERVASRTMSTCHEGHISDEYGRCMAKGCKFSRGYKPPKEKRGGESGKARKATSNND